MTKSTSVVPAILLFIIFVVFNNQFLAQASGSKIKTELPEKQIKRLKKEKVLREKEKAKRMKEAKKAHLNLQSNTTNGFNRKKQMKKMERKRKKRMRKYKS